MTGVPETDHRDGVRTGITGQDEKGKHHLQHVVRIVGSDGYAVAVSVGEIDPEFEGKRVILTDDPTPGIRLIVFGDKRAGRDVREVVRIDDQ